MADDNRIIRFTPTPGEVPEYDEEGAILRSITDRAHDIIHAARKGDIDYVMFVGVQGDDVAFVSAAGAEVDSPIKAFGSLERAKSAILDPEFDPAEEIDGGYAQ